jgi:Domain of unknown function (DUF4328)
MTSQQDISGEYGEEAPIQNSSPDLLEKVTRQEVRPPAFERSGGLRTAVIVTAVLYIAGNWLSTPVTSQLIASGTPGAFIAYNVWVALLLLVAIVNFVLVGLWLGRARRNADRIAPDQQSLSSVWVWLGWIVPIVNFWFPSRSSTTYGEAPSVTLQNRELAGGGAPSSPRKCSFGSTACSLLSWAISARLSSGCSPPP